MATHHDMRLRVTSPEHAQRTFFRRRTTRLVWTDPTDQPVPAANQG